MTGQDPGGAICDVAGAVDAGRAGDAAARSAALAEVIRSVAVAGRAATEQQSCTYGFGKCDRTDTRAYAVGGRWRCAEHSPSALAGQPEPDRDRYCLAICYCKQPDCAADKRQPLAPTTDNIIDFRHKASGKRRSSPAAFREARDRTRGAAS